MYVGTTEQLINALEHMADKRRITKAEKMIVREAAFRLRITEKEEAEAAHQNTSNDKE